MFTKTKAPEMQQCYKRYQGDEEQHKVTRTQSNIQHPNIVPERAFIMSLLRQSGSALLPLTAWCAIGRLNSQSHSRLDRSNCSSICLMGRQPQH